MKICLHCGFVAKDNYTLNFCPNERCCGIDEDFVELDERIAPAIFELNRKGYRTRYSCSGHITQSAIYSAYILFDNISNMQAIPSIDKLKELAKYRWYLDTADFDIMGYRPAIRYAPYYNTPIFSIINTEIDFAMQGLQEWVSSLPNAGEDGSKWIPSDKDIQELIQYQNAWRSKYDILFNCDITAFNHFELLSNASSSPFSIADARKELEGSVALIMNEVKLNHITEDRL